MKRFLRNGPVKWLLLLASAMLPAVHLCAEETGHLQIEPDQQVVYCEAQWPGAGESLTQALQSGIAVTLVWHVQVSEIQKYWLNKNIADIKVSRRVIPDLLSRTWLLEDETSGISRQTSSLEEAVQFLTRLEHFPVLDRSLLTAGTQYRISVAIEEFEGEIKEDWWVALWNPGQFRLEKDFSLP